MEEAIRLHSWDSRLAFFLDFAPLPKLRPTSSDLGPVVCGPSLLRAPSMRGQQPLRFIARRKRISRTLRSHAERHEVGRRFDNRLGVQALQAQEAQAVDALLGVHGAGRDEGLPGPSRFLEFIMGLLAMPQPNLRNETKRNETGIMFIIFLMCISL